MGARSDGGPVALARSPWKEERNLRRDAMCEERDLCSVGETVVIVVVVVVVVVTVVVAIFAIEMSCD